MRVAPFIALVVVSIVSVSSAQSRKVTEDDIAKLVAAAVEKREGKIYRQIVTTTGYKEGDSYEGVFEFGPNNTYQYRIIRRSNGIETKDEGIRIGDVRYTRQSDGSWIKETPKENGRGSGQGSGYGSAAQSSPPPEVTAEYRYVGSDKVNGTNADRYRKTRVTKFASRDRTITRRGLSEYWFSADGLLLKETSEDMFENSKQRYKSVTVYEYANIRITAPIPE